MQNRFAAMTGHNDYIRESSSFYDRPFSRRELYLAQSRLRPKKADSIFKLNPKFWKFLATNRPMHLLFIMNNEYNNGTFTDLLKYSSITNLPKKGTRPLHVTDFRTIVASSTIAKLFEYLILPRLIYFAEHAELLNRNQFGSLDSGTIDMLMTFDKFVDQDDWIIISLDVKAAYDLVDANSLLKTFDYALFPTNLFNCLKNFLFDRKVVYIGSQGSHEMSTSNGLMQGSVLAPFLFAIYFSKMIGDINSLCSTHFGPNACCLSYIDDICIIIKLNNRFDLSYVSKVNSLINNICSAFSSNNIILSQEK